MNLHFQRDIGSLCVWANANGRPYDDKILGAMAHYRPAEGVDGERAFPSMHVTVELLWAQFTFGVHSNNECPF